MEVPVPVLLLHHFGTPPLGKLVWGAQLVKRLPLPKKKGKIKVNYFCCFTFLHYLEWIMSTVTSKRKAVEMRKWESGRRKQQEFLL